jgi:hypothetical protein
MNNHVLTDKQALAIALLLSSISYNHLKGDEWDELHNTLTDLNDQIGLSDEQYELWLRIGSPSWEQTREIE